MRKPELQIDITGPDGNIYFMLIRTREVLRKKRRLNDYNILQAKVFNSKSYKQAVNEINQVVKLIDISERQELTKLLSN